MENKSLKELTNDAALAASKKKIESLEVMNNFLQSEKEELILQISAKNKKIELLERRVHELTEMRTNAVNGSNNGVCGDSDAHINELDEELRKCKHRVAELEVSGLCCLKRMPQFNGYQCSSSSPYCNRTNQNFLPDLL